VPGSLGPYAVAIMPACFFRVRRDAPSPAHPALIYGFVQLRSGAGGLRWGCWRRRAAVFRDGALVAMLLGDLPSIAVPPRSAIVVLLFFFLQWRDAALKRSRRRTERAFDVDRRDTLVVRCSVRPVCCSCPCATRMHDNVAAALASGRGAATWWLMTVLARERADAAAQPGESDGLRTPAPLRGGRGPRGVGTRFAC
jgi:hypothetical protein